MAKANPFFDFDPAKMPEFAKLPDYSKMLSDLKLPGVDMDTWMSVNKRSFEAMTAASQTAVQCAQAVAQRQGEILRQAMEGTGRAAKDMVAAGSPEEKAARQAELAKEAFAAAATNMRDLAEMVTKSTAEAFDTVTKRMTENLEEIRASLVRKQAK